MVERLTPILQQWEGKGTYIDPFVGGGSISALVRRLFPNTKQYVSDANPWLMAAFQSQIEGCTIADNYMAIDYWRALKDEDIGKLSVAEKANKFAVCLFTAWGNRWKSKADGSMGNENPVNPKFAKPEYLKKRLEAFFTVNWLRSNDTIACADWKKTIKTAKAGDLVYIDPPYPESLGYGNQWWSFSDQLDVTDWVADAVKQDINIVVSNMATVERLYKRAGLETVLVNGPKTSKTRTNRAELIAWCLH
jgi:DNA adenine methylase